MAADPDVLIMQTTKETSGGPGVRREGRHDLLCRARAVQDLNVVARSSGTAVFLVNAMFLAHSTERVEAASGRAAHHREGHSTKA